MTHDHYPYAWDKEGRGMVVLDNPLGLQSKKSYVKIKSPAMIIGLIE